MGSLSGSVAGFFEGDPRNPEVSSQELIEFSWADDSCRWAFKSVQRGRPTFGASGAPRSIRLGAVFPVATHRERERESHMGVVRMSDVFEGHHFGDAVRFSLGLVFGRSGSPGWLAGLGWSVGRSVGWLVGWFVGWLVSWLVGRSVS